MASLAEIRFAQKIKPGLTDENKKEEYKFQKYGDVFIWYEILNNCSDEDDIVFIENEKKEDWWESKDSGIIASELKEEFKEKFPHADIEMLSFDDFYAKYMDDIMEDGEAKIEINAVLASAVKRGQKAYGTANSSLILVIPYSVANMDCLEKFYDEVWYPEELYGVHHKAAITKRNEWFVEHSDLLVAYVERDNGGASVCLKKAEKKGIETKNIALEEE